MSTTILKNHVLYADYRSVVEICKPLEEINTHGFIFIRHFRDGRFIDLSNQIEWSDHFLNKYMQQKYPSSAITDHMFIAEGISLWSLNKENIIWQEGENFFDFGNGISIAINKEKYTDIFCFYTHKDQLQMNEFYISNLGLLRKFSDYFLEKAAPLIKRELRDPLITPGIYSKNKPVINKDEKEKLLNKFLSVIDPAYQHIKKAGRITPRELNCINLCAKGKSAKQIGKELFLSSRTVETHLKNARLKLECSNLAELISIVIKYYDQK